VPTLLKRGICAHTEVGMNGPMETLNAIRKYAGTRVTLGLSDEILEKFFELDPSLPAAIKDAARIHQELCEEYGELLAGDETDLVDSLQADFINFYPANTINPYVSMAAAGPWLITTHGAVIHDNGGYGMLGLGHSPCLIMAAMSNSHVMANIMTPNISHARFSKRLKAEVGQLRGHCPFEKFICMNSGSESVTVAFRISDVNALKYTSDGGRHANKPVRILSLAGSFHGRTDRPAQASDSCIQTYKKNLATHASNENLVTIPVNDIEALRAAYATAESDGYFIEMMLMEPVMGEGDPGQSIDRAFYDVARELTLAHGSLLLVDSIQAGIRGTGYLSIVDYPGFEDCHAPDMETYSKALNAGQYPLSVLACNERASQLYVRGIYGNTMTSNPRALEVGCAVLDNLTDEIRQNIRLRGDQMVEGLKGLMVEFPEKVLHVQGTGLLFSAELDPSIEVVGFNGIETWLRKNGLGVIHGGENSLRFTPHFWLSEEEVELLVDLVRQGIRAFMAQEQAAS
jgi:acetylornithine/succinyldiaminopimelate/putrescine aminotransferase